MTVDGLNIYGHPRCASFCINLLLQDLPDLCTCTIGMPQLPLLFKVLLLERRMHQQQERADVLACSAMRHHHEKAAMHT